MRSHTIFGWYHVKVLGLSLPAPRFKPVRYLLIFIMLLPPIGAVTSPLAMAYMANEIPWARKRKRRAEIRAAHFLLKFQPRKREEREARRLARCDKM